MATLKKSVLGKVSGAVGDILFRMKDGKNYVGTRPISFMPGTDNKSISRRNRFRIACKFSKHINRIFTLKALWNRYTPDTMLPYNGMIKVNYYNVTPDDVSNSASLVPEIGFEIPGFTVTKSSTQIIVELLPIGTGTNIDTVQETQFLLTGVLYLKDRKDENFKLYEFLDITFPVAVLNLVNPITFTHSMSDYEKQLFERYNIQKGFFALLSLNPDDEPVHFSNTFVS